MTAIEREAAPARRIYSRAPIVEAVIDLQVRYGQPPELAAFTHLADSLVSAFPTRHAIRSFSVQLSNEELGAPSSRGRQTGWKLLGSSNDRVLQLQEQGFTYSHMAPYTRWEIFKGEALPLWARFVEVCKPDRVARVAVRYINRLLLPPGRIDLREYLRVRPEAPDSLVSSAFFLQTQIPQPALGPKALAAIAVASQPSSDPNSPVVIDLDVYQEPENLAPDDEKVWVLLEALRNKKNDLFEACLTDKAREMIA